MRINWFVFFMVAGIMACDFNPSSSSSYEAPGSEYYPPPEGEGYYANRQRQEPVPTVDAGPPDHTCPRPGAFGLPIHCCPTGICETRGTASNLISTGYQVEIGPRAAVRYIDTKIDVAREGPWRSVIIEARWTHVSLVRDTSPRFRHQVAVLVRPLDGAQFTGISDTVSTEPCSVIRAHHTRPPNVQDDPWICIDLTPDTRIRQLTLQEHYDDLIGHAIQVPLNVAQ